MAILLIPEDSFRDAMKTLIKSAVNQCIGLRQKLTEVIFVNRHAKMTHL